MKWTASVVIYLWRKRILIGINSISVLNASDVLSKRAATCMNSTTEINYAR